MPLYLMRTLHTKDSETVQKKRLCAYTVHTVQQLFVIFYSLEDVCCIAITIIVNGGGEKQRVKKKRISNSCVCLCILRIVETILCYIWCEIECNVSAKVVYLFLYFELSVQNTVHNNIRVEKINKTKRVKRDTIRARKSIKGIFK